MHTLAYAYCSHAQCADCVHAQYAQCAYCAYCAFARTTLCVRRIRANERAYFFFNEVFEKMLQKKILVKLKIFTKFRRKKPALTCSCVGSGKGRFSGEGSCKGEGEVLSVGWGAFIRRKNIRYTKEKRFVR